MKLSSFFNDLSSAYSYEIEDLTYDWESTHPAGRVLRQFVAVDRQIEEALGEGNPQLILAGRGINDGMAAYVASKVLQFIIQHNIA